MQDFEDCCKLYASANAMACGNRPWDQSCRSC